MKTGYTYILTNKSRTTLYIGVTNDINRRLLEHKAGVGSAFTSQYQLTVLLCFEEFADIQEAIAREKQLKRWHKDWKWNHIKKDNSKLKDLAVDWHSKKEIEQFKKDFAEYSI